MRQLLDVSIAIYYGFTRTSEEVVLFAGPILEVLAEKHESKQGKNLNARFLGDADLEN